MDISFRRDITDMICNCLYLILTEANATIQDIDSL